MATSDSTSERAEFRVHVVSWNIASSPLTLNDVLTLFEFAGADPLSSADIVVVGLQEAYQSVPEAISAVIGSDDTVELFGRYLVPKGYVRLSSCRMLGVVVMAFVRRQLLLYIRDTEVCATRTGLGGWLGIKGGASVRFTLGDLSVCFTNCHLSPHPEDNARRTGEIRHILQSQTFEINSRLQPAAMLMMDHDVLVVFGDLNFRLEDRGFDEVVELAGKKKYEGLLLCDQLRLEQLKGDRGTSGLDYFMEMPITFPPTYKYTPGTDQFSSLGKGPAQRAPAWCDRILWNVHERQYPKINDPNPQPVVKPEGYTIHMEPRVSDHKAVSGGLRILADVRGFSPKVVFLLQTWWVSEDALIVFDVAEGTVISYWDWIGLYRANFTSEKDYAHRSLTPVARGTSAKSHCSCFKISGAEMPSQPGYYVLIYKSVEYGRVIGMSPVFPIVHRESLVSEDWEIVES